MKEHDGPDRATRRDRRRVLRDVLIGRRVPAMRAREEACRPVLRPEGVDHDDRAQHWPRFRRTRHINVEGFRGSAELGCWIAGGLYEYEGRIDGGDFTATYKSEDDRGVFKLKRVK